MNKIEIILSPVLYEYRTLRKHTTVVCVDILRATTSICSAFAAGAEQIVPIGNLEQLWTYHRLGYLLAAERNGEKIGDAEYGNSPTEYSKSDLHGKRLAYSTTNGTNCLLTADDADHVWVGAFSNISALVEKLVRAQQDVVILCSGWEKEFSLEDTLFAGALAKRLTDSGLYAPENDAVWMAMELWHQGCGDLYAYCQKASHVQRLLRHNYDEDIRYALRLDTCTLVPEMKEGVLVCDR